MKLYLDGKIFNGTEEELLAIQEFTCKEWRLDGKRHRIDGPAVIYSNGYQAWYQNDKLHRADGPATIFSSGKKEWYLEGFEFYEFFNNFFPIEIFKKKRRMYKK